MNTLGTRTTPGHRGAIRGILCLDRRYVLRYDSDGNTQKNDHRCRVLGLMAMIDDGHSRFLCIVDDLSKKGVRLTQIPSNLNETTEKFTALILSPLHNFKISLHSRWSKTTNGGMYKTIGFQLNTASSEWLRFVSGLQNKPGAFSCL